MRRLKVLGGAVGAAAPSVKRERTPGSASAAGAKKRSGGGLTKLTPAIESAPAIRHISRATGSKPPCERTTTGCFTVPLTYASSWLAQYSGV